MLLYTKTDAKKYQSFSNTEKKECKTVIANLLRVNKIKRNSDTIGVWFKNPDHLENSSITQTITLPTMLFTMKTAIAIIIEKRKAENNELFNFFK